MIAYLKSATVTDVASFYEFSSSVGDIKVLSVGENFGLKVGESVRLGVKSSDVAIATSRVENSSISNLLSAELVDIKIGKVLASVTLRLNDGSLLESIITANSASLLGLSSGIRVFALLKATSFYIKEKI